MPRVRSSSHPAVAGAESWRPLRVAVIANALPSAGRNTGGVSQVAHDLAQGLVARGHQVVAWTYEGVPRDAAYQVRRLPGSRFATSRVGRFLTEGYLGNLLTALPGYRDADAVVAMGDSLLLPVLGKPVVRVMQGSALGEALAARSIHRAVAQFGIYPQELLSAALLKGSVTSSRSTLRHNPFIRRVIPNGTDLSTFFPDPDARSAAPSILFVGTLEGRKRGRLLLELFEAEVRVRFPEATLTVVGPPGPARSGVTYRTGIPRSELAALYRRAWVYASPSVYEGWGLPYVEAMASGTPVLASANPGSRDVLGEGAYGVIAADDAFASELMSLLEEEGRRERLIAKGLERAAEYSSERMLDGYEKLLFEICA